MSYPTRNTSSFTTPHLSSNNFLLKEDGDYLLLESGGTIRLEQNNQALILPTRNTDTYSTPTRN